LSKITGLSAVIITFNEERNIRRCLESLVPVADEIVVVDSFSTDRTAEICQEFNVKFICNRFDGHIEQKNFAAMQAQFDWVLSLDADEALSETLRNSILHLKADAQQDAYLMNRLTNYCGTWVHHSGWYPDTKARLWNRTKGNWGGTNPHDKWELYDKKASYGKLNGDLLHYSYYSISEHIKQIEYFSEIAAKAEAAMGKNPSIIKLLVGPWLKFIKCYLIKRGFLDGYTGYIISRLTAQATFIKYIKTRRYAQELKQNQQLKS